MRRRILGVLMVLAILGMLAPPVFAQAPAPKVSYRFLIDQITSLGKNIYDGDFSNPDEDEWYARMRARPDFVFEVGRTKAVLGLEFDLQYGDSTNRKPGTNGVLDLNTDTAGVTELKWAYTEFDLTGKNSLLPFIPVESRATAGAQPFGSSANYKVAYANGDYAGLDIVSTWAPNIKSNLLYVQVEEETFNDNRLNNSGQVTGGDDYAIIVAFDITPFKGLDIKPLYSYFRADGVTNGSARRSVSNATTITVTGEDRHTFGIDARWKSGPWYLDPTFYYQTGTRDGYVGAASREADIDAWLVDLQGGWRLGPLLLEARYIYTSGNEAKDDLSSEINYFEPLNLDTGYWAGWASIIALGTDYFNGGGGTLRGMSSNIGYDRYGRHGFGLRGRYSLTPALSFWGSINPTWTAEKVDTDTPANRSGLTATSQGDERYIGTEADIGVTYAFAPNTTFDLSGAWLFAGNALDTRASATAPKNNAEDGYTVAARVRFAF